MEEKVRIKQVRRAYRLEEKEAIEKERIEREFNEFMFDRKLNFTDAKTIEDWRNEKFEEPSEFTRAFTGAMFLTELEHDFPKRFDSNDACSSGKIYASVISVSENLRAMTEGLTERGRYALIGVLQELEEYFHKETPCIRVQRQKTESFLAEKLPLICEKDMQQQSKQDEMENMKKIEDMIAFFYKHDWPILKNCPDIKTRTGRSDPRRKECIGLAARLESMGARPCEIRDVLKKKGFQSFQGVKRDLDREVRTARQEGRELFEKAGIKLSPPPGR